MKEYCTGSTLLCAPRYEIHGIEKQKRYLVMQYLDEDLEDYICKFPAGKERDAEIQKMANSMLESIQKMHDHTNHVHRDIKPPNFRVH